MDRGGGIGRRVGIKIQWPLCRKGSSPFLGTFFKKIKQKAFNMKTQTISRCDLSAIYPLVCDGWKKKIVEHLVEQCNTDTIVVSNDLIKQAYAAADSDQKKLLQKHFDISFGRSTTLAGIAKELGISEDSLYIFPKDTKDKHERYLNACNIIPKISKVYNEGVVLNWKDTSQYKYMPYKNFDYGRVVVYSWAYTLFYSVGFYFKDNETAQAAYDNFSDLWEDFWGA